MDSTQPSNSLRRWFDVWNAGESQLVRGLFSRVLGIVYLVAFVSFATQVLGLIRTHGLLPIGDYLNAVQRALGASGYFFAPTLLWVNSSDLALQILPWVGAALAVLLVFGFSHPLLYLALYLLYLSLVTAGQDFMAFQWDNLLLEVGFLAIFLRMPGSLIVWLYRILLFKPHVHVRRSQAGQRRPQLAQPYCAGLSLLDAAHPECYCVVRRASCPNGCSAFRSPQRCSSSLPYRF